MPDESLRCLILGLSESEMAAEMPFSMGAVRRSLKGISSRLLILRTLIPTHLLCVPLCLSLLLPLLLLQTRR